MDSGYLPIGAWGVAAAALLMGVNLVLSALLRLGLAGKLIVASLRMAAQLSLLGLVLRWVFDLRQPLAIAGLGVVMAGVAGISAVRRTRRRFPGIFWNSLVTVAAAAYLVTGFGLIASVRAQPWWDPQYLVPMLGMVLGNTLNGISLALDRFMEEMTSQRDRVEGLLALGATSWEACHEGLREAVRTGMIPTLNSMLVMGIVSLPGMMTGQILAGADPADAVRYQIVIVFMISAASGLGCMGVTLLAYRSLFDRRHRLLADRLKEAGG